jgi:ribose transport system substrate-binding protein
MAACSSPSDTTSGATGSGSQPTGVKTAQQRLDEITANPTMKTPGAATSFDANKAAGKTVYYINTNDSLPVSVIWENGVVDALTPYGVKVVRFDGKGSSTEYNKGMRQAIGQKADAIFNLAIAPQFVQQSIKDAAAAGIPVISATDGVPDLRKNKDFVEGLTAEVSYDYEKVGRLEADWFVADSKGKGHALFISNLDQPSAVYVTDGFKAEVQDLCPDCKVTTKDVPASQVATLLPTLVQTQLRADPSINYIVPDYDFQVPNIVAALRQSNLAKKVKVGSWNAVPPVMTLLKDQISPVSMDMGAPNAWFSYAIADTILRTLVGEKPGVWGGADSNYLGIKAFTKQSVANLEVSKYSDEVNYGLSADTVRAEFEKLWGAPKHL